ncbi:unnamed protein product, partial [marine sediment metagenome]
AVTGGIWKEIKREKVVDGGYEFSIDHKSLTFMSDGQTYSLTFEAKSGNENVKVQKQLVQEVTKSKSEDSEDFSIIHSKYSKYFAKCNFFQKINKLKLFDGENNKHLFDREKFRTFYFDSQKRLVLVYCEEGSDQVQVKIYCLLTDDIKDYTKKLHRASKRGKYTDLRILCD